MSKKLRAIWHRNAEFDIPLCDDNLRHIFSFLSVDELLRISLVNKRWCRVSWNNELWKPFFAQYVLSFLPFLI
jgi:hypothetical protein